MGNFLNKNGVNYLIRLIKEAMSDMTLRLTNVIAPKADKVTNAINGNFAALDASGNLTDSGKKASDFDLVVSMTYSELKTLRDGENLVAGTWYRITDYECTTSQENTQSAGHQFDILVQAIDESHLSEEAKSCHSSSDSSGSSTWTDTGVWNDNNMWGVGSSYFTNSKVEAWQIWYCLDNDTDRFAWADDENGKGVIYRMIDEWGNDCPYDFKNMLFKRYKIDTCVKSPSLEGLFGIDGGNEYTVDTDTAYWCYTFCMIDTSDNTPHDVSVEQDVFIHDEGYYQHNYNNVMKAYHKADYDGDPVVQKMYLPNNVFVTDTDICAIEEGYGEFCGFYANTLGSYCYNNTFGNYFQNNTFGNDCYYNTFGNNCYYNTFGNSCFRNTFGNDCFRNTFGNYFQNNTFGNSCSRNTFGNDCQYNTFGNNCTDNTFGNDCGSNTFGNNCGSNTFGNGCYSNTFGNYVRYNTFGNNCYYNTFGNYVRQLTVFEGVTYCSITGGSSSNSYVQNAQILNGTSGTNSSNLLTITFVANVNYTQIAGKNSSGVLKIWTPADMV